MIINYKVGFIPCHPFFKEKSKILENCLFLRVALCKKDSDIDELEKRLL